MRRLEQLALTPERWARGVDLKSEVKWVEPFADYILAMARVHDWTVTFASNEVECNCPDFEARCKERKRLCKHGVAAMLSSPESEKLIAIAVEWSGITLTNKEDTAPVSKEQFKDILLKGSKEDLATAAKMYYENHGTTINPQVYKTFANALMEIAEEAGKAKLPAKVEQVSGDPFADWNAEKRAAEVPTKEEITKRLGAVQSAAMIGFLENSGLDGSARLSANIKGTLVKAFWGLLDAHQKISKEKGTTIPRDLTQRNWIAFTMHAICQTYLTPEVAEKIQANIQFISASLHKSRKKVDGVEVDVDDSEKKDNGTDPNAEDPERTKNIQAAVAKYGDVDKIPAEEKAALGL